MMQVGWQTLSGRCVCGRRVVSCRGMAHEVAWHTTTNERVWENKRVLFSGESIHLYDTPPPYQSNNAKCMSIHDFRPAWLTWWSTGRCNIGF
jgi:hypothetical protein